MKIKFECKYGATANRKCLIAFSGNGRNICRLYEQGKCTFDKNGNKQYK